MTSRKSGKSWFQELFGFAEVQQYSRNKQQFDFQDGILTSKANGREFYVGPFETPSVQELQQQLSALPQDADAGGGLTFQHIVGHAFHRLHFREENAGAVFQASSQFNCLAPSDPDESPDWGITSYYRGREEASECAMACPAATVFRNYMVGKAQAGQGGRGKQLDCLADVADLVGNVESSGRHKYWKTENGFCMPDELGGIADLSQKLEADSTLLEQAKGKLRVGVHEDTEVRGCGNRVCQVLCAAVPVTCMGKHVPARDWPSPQDWEVFARAVLEATYEATFCQAAILAAKRKARVKLFLTTIGLGRGCPPRWIVDAMKSALDKHSRAALDVMLVHYTTAVPTDFAVLAERRSESTDPLPVLPPPGPPPEDDPTGYGNREKLVASFGSFDLNGDGVIDKEEFRTALQRLDPKFFTEENIEALFQAADATRDGKVYYHEFVAWLLKAKGDVVHRVTEEEAQDASLTDAHVDSAAMQRVRVLCNEFDADNDGAITKPELYRALRQEFPDTVSSDLDDIVASADLNGDGIIQFDEFLNWMLLPQGAKVSFEDSIRQQLLHDTEPEGEGTGELLWTADEGTTGEEAFLRTFVNPLLDRFSTAGHEAEPPSNGNSDNCVTVQIDEARRHRTRQGGASTIRATMKSLGQVRGEWEELQTVLKVLSEEYGRIFSEFCAHIQSKPQGSDANNGSSFTLHCPAIPVCDMRNRPKRQSPERVWSAIALALAGLNWQQREMFSQANCMMYIGDSSASLDDARGVLQKKLQACEEVCKPERRGTLKRMEGDHSWIRKINTAEARLHRLQMFVCNQHIICSGHYSLVSAELGAQAPQVPLYAVTEMISQTRLHLATEVVQGGAGAAKMQIVLPHEREIGRPGEFVPVMEIARVLTQQGHKVAAVNAASAYHVGGGVASGGRHALEEAWCSQSTLFQSLISVESETHGSSQGGSALHQHVPTNGVIVSPGVELFRAGTDSGYGLQDEPTKLTCVVSVAMFNRNPGVSDSPLDSPSDTREYVAQTCQKLKATVSGAVSCGATVLVVPDVGCGVFMNDPTLVGSCLGKVLLEYSADLDTVVISAMKDDMLNGVKNVVQRVWASETEVNDYLVNLATTAAEPQKPVCRFGASCKFLWKKEHTDMYSHPDAPAKSGSTGRQDVRHSGRAQPNDAVQVVAGKDKPICHYGEACYQKNPQHLREFRHPWADGTETPEERQARIEETLMHKILDEAKNESWPAVFRALGHKSDLVSAMPAGRSYGLIHFAAYQKNAAVIVNLVRVYNADATMRSGKGETVAAIFRQAIKEVPARGGSQEETYDRDVLKWLEHMERAQAADAGLSGSHHLGAAQSGHGHGGHHGQHGGGHQQGQQGLDTLVVQCADNERLAGVYVQDGEEEYNGSPVYVQQRGAGSTRSSKLHHIYCSLNEDWGWVINPVPKSGLVMDKRPLAYLGPLQNQRRRQGPWDLDAASRHRSDDWKVFKYLPGGGQFITPSQAMSVCRR